MNRLRRDQQQTPTTVIPTETPKESTMGRFLINTIFTQSEPIKPNLVQAAQLSIHIFIIFLSLDTVTDAPPF